MARWLATPFVTFTIGDSGGVTFTTLGIGNRKMITSVNVEQLNETTIKYKITLDYYPPTFQAGSPNLVELQFLTAMSNENTRKTYLKFGYVSNSPYTGGGESSPVYEGFVTNFQTNVQANHVVYDIEGYGCDLVWNYGITINDNFTKLIRRNDNVGFFIKRTLLSDGKVSMGGKSFNFKIVFDNDDFSNLTMYKLLTGINYGSLPIFSGVSQALTNYVTSSNKELADMIWNNAKEAFSSEIMSAKSLDESDTTLTQSANNENIYNKNQYSAFEVLQIVLRLINNYYLGKHNYSYQFIAYCDGYDGILRIFDAMKINEQSKKIFYYGRWDGGVLSTIPKVVDWSCNYNATAMLYKGNTAKGYSEAEELALNSDIEIDLSNVSDMNSGVINALTDIVDPMGAKTLSLQTKQYKAVLSDIQKIFDYPYKATITVLGISDPISIAQDTIEVQVFVNGTAHHTSGRYLIIGCSHDIVSASNVFTTTYELVKLPEGVSASKLSDTGVITVTDNGVSYTQIGRTKYYSS